MIKKIFTNEFDLFNLSLKRTVPTLPTKKVNYRGVVVDKPWGYEYLMFENKQVAIWILFLKYKTKTSIHCHPKKKTSLIVLDGKVKTSSLDSSFNLKNMDGIIIERGVFHSTSAMSKEGSFIMEIETPPQKDDLVRLKDEYGRENSGYESGRAISSKLENYEYCHIHPSPTKNKEIQKLIKEKTIKICHSSSWKELSKKLKKNKETIFGPLNYKILDKNGRVFLETGDIIEVKDIKQYDEIIATPKRNLVSLLIS